MGAVISFGDCAQEVWVGQGWLFDAVLQDVLAIAPRDEQVVTELEGKLAVGGLSFPLLDSALAAPIAATLKKVLVAVTNDQALPGMKWREACVRAAYGEHTAEECIRVMQRSARELLGMLISYERRHVASTPAVADEKSTGTQKG